MNYLVDHHRAVADPFGLGHTAPQLGLMMHLTRGWQFPWLEGGVALVRRELYPDLHEWTYCGIAVTGQTQIKNYPGMTHSIDQAYQYAAASFLGNGMISQTCEPIRLDFDSNGDLISPRLPMFPINVCAEPLTGGKFRVVWEYDPFGQGDFPTDFQVFEGADPGSVDYNTPLGTVVYSGIQRVYDFTTGAFGDLTSHVFSVRGRNSSGTAEKNIYTTEPKTARAAAPSSSSAPTRVNMRPYSRHAG